MFKWIILAVIAVTSNLVVAQQNAKQAAPQWSLQTQAGDTLSSADFAGQPLIIHFWATWCPYCKKLQPGLERLHQAYAEQGLQVIGISFREDDGADPAGVLADRGISFTTLVQGEQVAADFGVTGTPTTVFVDSNGDIFVTTRISDPDDPRLEQAVKRLVAPKTLQFKSHAPQSATR